MITNTKYRWVRSYTGVWGHITYRCVGSQQERGRERRVGIDWWRWWDDNDNQHQIQVGQVIYRCVRSHYVQVCEVTLRTGVWGPSKNVVENGELESIGEDGEMTMITNTKYRWGRSYTRGSGHIQVCEVTLRTGVWGHSKNVVENGELESIGEDGEMTMITNTKYRWGRSYTRGSGHIQVCEVTLRTGVWGHSKNVVEKERGRERRAGIDWGKWWDDNDNQHQIQVGQVIYRCVRSHYVQVWEVTLRTGVWGPSKNVVENGELESIGEDGEMTMITNTKYRWSRSYTRGSGHIQVCEVTLRTGVWGHITYRCVRSHYVQVWEVTLCTGVWGPSKNVVENGELESIGEDSEMTILTNTKYRWVRSYTGVAGHKKVCEVTLRTGVWGHSKNVVENGELESIGEDSEMTILTNTKYRWVRSYTGVAGHIQVCEATLRTGVWGPNKNVVENRELESIGEDGEMTMITNTKYRWVRSYTGVWGHIAYRCALTL